MNPPSYVSARGAVITHAGKVRPHNEDAFFCGYFYSQADLNQPVAFQCQAGQPWMVAVADGIGGQNAGEKASHQLVVLLSQCANLTPAGVCAVLCNLNRDFFDQGQADPALHGMGAAVAGLFFGPEGLFAYNVGDARVYRQQDGFLVQVNRDDSLAQMLNDAMGMDNGYIRPEYLHTLTQAVGGQHEYRQIEPHFYPLRAADRTRFLVCTDGLTDYVALEDMERVLAATPDDLAATDKLYHAAMDAGGRDNITIAVFEINGMSDAPPAR